MRLQIRPTALEDLARGRRFYDLQELGVGDYFFDSVFADIDSLKLYAGIHPKVFGLHRMLTQRFPYAVYHESPNKESIIVWRVLDLRRDPQSIRSALGSIKTEVVFEATEGGGLVRAAPDERVRRLQANLDQVRGSSDTGRTTDEILAETRERFA